MAPQLRGLSSTWFVANPIAPCIFCIFLGEVYQVVQQGPEFQNTNQLLRVEIWDVATGQYKSTGELLTMSDDMLLPSDHLLLDELPWFLERPYATRCALHYLTYN